MPPSRASSISSRRCRKRHSAAVNARSAKAFALPYVHFETRERELARDLVDDVDLAGVEAGPEAARRHLELENRGVAVRRIDHRPFDHRRLEHFDAPAIERQTRAQLRHPRILGGIVDLVEKVQLLVAADDVREVGDELDAVAYERARRLAAHRV